MPTEREAVKQQDKKKSKAEIQKFFLNLRVMEKKILMNSCGWKVRCCPLLVVKIYYMQYL